MNVDDSINLIFDLTQPSWGRRGRRYNLPLGQSCRAKGTSGSKIPTVESKMNDGMLGYIFFSRLEMQCDVLARAKEG